MITDSSLQNNAVVLLDMLNSSGCSQGYDADVATFQQSYNASANGNLKVDGLYGPLTQGALQAVINANPNNSNLNGETAPAGCVKPGGGGANPPIVVGSSGASPLPYIIGAVVVAGALAAYTYSKSKHRR